MVHELGHCIGFRHTNWAQILETAGTIGAVHIPGTPVGTDSKSVMNGNAGNTSWDGFSSYDIIAAQTIYPSEDVKVTITGPQIVDRGMYDYQVTGLTDIKGSLTWHGVDDRDIAYLNADGTKTRITFRSAGQYSLKVSGITVNGNSIISSSFTVQVNDARGRE